MSNVIVAYIPVLHEGYRTFFENHKDADTLYLFGKEFISEHYYLEKDLRALTPELIKTAIESWNFFKNIDILTKENIALLNNKEIIMPDEDISHDFKDNYLTDTNVTFDPMFLRWEKINLRREKKVGVEITMTENEFMNSAFLESKKSSDWWRQVGAVLVKEGKILLSKSNQHVPSSQQPYVDGDPRCLSVKGQDLDLYPSLHAEAGIIAEAAKKGIPLEGAEMYVTDFPCPTCAKQIAYSGIKKVYFTKGYAVLDGERILKNNNIEIIKIEKKATE